MSTVAVTDLRIVPVRPYEPHYDDEATAPAVVDGALALAIPHTRRREGGLRLVPPQQPPAGTDHELRRWAGRLVQAVTEAYAGDRPVAQLAPYLSSSVYSGLQRRLASVARPRGATRPPASPAVRSIHVCEPSPGVAEVAAVVRRGPRTAAMALRLEMSQGRWRCTALQVG